MSRGKISQVPFSPTNTNTSFLETISVTYITIVESMIQQLQNTEETKKKKKAAPF